MYLVLTVKTMGLVIAVAALILWTILKEIKSS